MAYKSKADQAAAARRHYERNRAAVIARARAAGATSRERVSAYLREVKSEPCQDCGLRWPWYVMQFDHVGSDKRFDVGAWRQRGMSLASVQAEVAKCELVCANCHAIRTYGRAQEVARVGLEPTA